jgi:glucose-1-phosphate adenylyltransferase
MNIDSLVCGGCITSGGIVRRSILGPSCRVNSYSLVEDSILFEGVDIGRHCRIKRTIIDEGVSVPEGTTIGFDLEADRARGIKVTDSGIRVVIRDNF